MTKKEEKKRTKRVASFGPLILMVVVRVFGVLASEVFVDVYLMRRGREGGLRSGSSMSVRMWEKDSYRIVTNAAGRAYCG